MEHGGSGREQLRVVLRRLQESEQNEAEDIVLQIGMAALYASGRAGARSLEELRKAKTVIAHAASSQHQVRESFRVSPLQIPHLSLSETRQQD